MTGLGKIGQNAAFKVFYLFLPCSRLLRALGCRPPNLEALPYALQHFSIFAKLIIADFEEKNAA